MTGALFDPLFGRTAVAAALDDRAWLAALCEVETALARACAQTGLIPLAAALEIGAAAAELSRADPDSIGSRAVAGGNPVIPLVELLRERVREQGGDEAAAAVHLGATSQDILDTATMLLTAQALGVIIADLGDAADRAAELARIHRDTPMSGRTLLQRAVPTTFGALAAVWGAGLDRGHRRLVSARAELPVQLGGAAGTLVPLQPRGAQVRAAFADELGLYDPDTVWHAERGAITDLAGALGSAAAALGKVAGDVVLLSQSEVGEVREAAPGGSSAMPHKQNPIAAITARAGALQAPGLVASVLTAAMPELQRGAGTWHAEWTPLTQLLTTVGGAASRLRTSLAGLSVDHGAMLRNIGDGPLDLGDAGDLVDRYLKGRG